jgi:dephospho-CoA kinase
MNSDAELVDQIRKTFGESAFDSTGKLNRRYLAEHVFGFPDRLEKLNNLVHPRVGSDYQNWVISQKNSHYVLKEAALLFESGSAKSLDKIIVVSAPENIRIKRVVSRDNRPEEEVRNIIHRQLPEGEAMKRADFVIANDESTLLIPQVLELHEKFMAVEKAVQPLK